VVQQALKTRFVIKRTQFFGFLWFLVFYKLLRFGQSAGFLEYLKA